MPDIAVVTDTDSSLPPAVAARYDIRQVPIVVQFGPEAFMTGVDLDDTELFARVDREGRLPTTSAPAPGQFAKAYEAAFATGAIPRGYFVLSTSQLPAPEGQSPRNHPASVITASTPSGCNAFISEIWFCSLHSLSQCPPRVKHVLQKRIGSGFRPRYVAA